MNSRIDIDSGTLLFPLTSSQREIYFDQVLYGKAPLYNVGGYLRIEGPVDHALFERSINLLAARHDCLRTVLVPGEQSDELPMQSFAPRMALQVPLLDFSGHADPHGAAMAWMQERFDQPFALFGEPLSRHDLLKIGPDCHYWLFQAHHLIVDGWAIAMIGRSTAAIYTALQAGEEPPPAAPSYVDFIEDDRAYVDSELFQRQRRHWLKKYDTLPEPLLPAHYRGHFAGPIAPSATHSLELPRALYDRLIDFAAKNGSTPFQTILAALYVYFVRSTGRDELVMGLPVLNRSNAAYKATMGLFVGVSAMRFRFGSELGFGQLLHAIAAELKQDYRHQRYPVSELNREVVLQQTGRQQLFDLRVSYERHDHDVRFGTAPGHAVGLLNSWQQTPLTLFVREFHQAQDVKLDFVYNQACFKPEEVEAIARRFTHILGFVLDHADASIAAIPLLDETDRAQLALWNDTRADYPAGETLVDLFEQQVRKTPDAVAVVFGDQQLSYAELNARANRLAHHLVDACGVGADTLVGLCVERTPHMVVGMLGILKAGAAYVPLDPAYPAARLALMLEDSAAPVLLTQSRLLTRLPRHAATIVEIDGPALDGSPAGNPAVRIDARQLAYVIYTSGSTGRPKGVAIEHRNTVNFVRWAQGEFSAQELARTLFSTSLNFDLAVYECFVPLSVGGRIEIVANALELADAPHDVSLVNTVPSALDALLQAGAVPPGVRTVNLAGEPLKQALVERLFADSEVERVCNLYGPSETTTYSTWVSMTREQGFAAHIGRPVANTQVHLLDEQGRQVPIGATGEIYIGGAGVARGYLNRPELTAQRFVADPFSSEPGARMYRTGDLARQRPDGNIEFLGRNDFQVKIRGFRIELGEIEARLAQHPAIREAVVVAREDVPGDKRLVAYITPRLDGGDEAARQLSEDQVSEWSNIWAETYEQTPQAVEQPGFDSTGWNSSYTRMPIPAPEMRDWLDGELGRIRALAPRRVLEIGCGSGMILLNVAPQCERYVGTDLSARTIEQLASRVRPLGAAVELVHAQAEDFSAVPALGYDTVILNSVVQYFPSIDYLQSVIEQAIAAVGPQGHIFLGDVRHHKLLEAFHLSVQLHQASPELSLADLAARASQKARSEAELLVDPSWFLALQERCPDITQVQVLPKEARYQNEMSGYRYDVVLSVRGAAKTAARQPEIDWIDCRDSDWPEHALKMRVEESTSAVVGLRGVPNPRVQQAVTALACLADEELPDVAALRAHLAAQPAAGMTPHELAMFCEERGWALRLSWLPNQAHGQYHAVITKQGTPVECHAGALMDVAAPRHENAAYANDPLRAKRMAALPDELRAHLLARLPEHMVPATYVALDAMPLTPNGKLDRKALPAPEGAGEGEHGHEAPAGEIEAAVARIWAQVLQVERIGRRSHFFELGGHSLLAVRVVSRLREALGVEVSLADLFDQPVLSGFALVVRRAARSALPPITVVDRTQPLPLSFAQQRLWFLAQMEGASQAYHMAGGFRLSGTLRRAELRRALDRIVARHEALRTRFELVDGQPVQRVATAGVGFSLREHDLSEHPDAAAELARLAAEEATAAFDLQAGPLIRGRLVRLGETEHVLLVTMHHIVSDGWSIGVMAREMGVLYAAYSQGDAQPLPELAIQYADYAAWQRRWLEGDLVQAQVAYWRNQLEGAPALLELPTDRPRPLQEDHAGAAFDFELDEPLTRALKALGQRHGTTLFMNLLAAWATLLGRLAGQEDVVIGTPVAYRNRAEVEPLIGFFVNTLALRLDLSGTPAVGELLQQVKARTLQAQQHQDLPFEQLVEILRPARSLAHNPLFQVMFAWQNNDSGDILLPGLKVVPMAVPHHGTLFDLRLDMWERDGRIAGSLEYATTLFDRDTVERTIGYLRRLLEAMVQDDTQALARVPLMDASERRRVLIDWNATEAAWPHDACIHELFEQKVQRTPQAVAVVCGSAQLTYDELNRRANRLAHFLRVCGVGPDARVALCVERSVEMVTAVLAILKAGGAYVPLDPAYPAERLAWTVEDSAPALLLMHGAIGADLQARLRLEMAAGGGAPVLDLLADASAWEQQPDSNPGRAGLALRHLAYVIYTSGSTGRPKGVAMPHRPLVNLVSWQCARTAAPLRTLQFAALGFDVAFQEMFTTLCAGGELHLIDRELRLDFKRLFAYVCERQVQRLFLPCVALQHLAEAAMASPDDGSALREVITAGEQLRITPAISGMFTRLPACRLHNHYGPTETHVVTSFVLDGDPAGWPALPPIGRPVANSQVYVLDSQRLPVPRGSVGELYLAGTCVARGYLNQDALTQERFVNDPFAARPGARMYKTGDRARHLPDGNIEFLGRNDFQLKIRGFRVEPGEIESRLGRYPGMGDTVVVAREDSPGDKRLVAYYTADDQAIIGADLLRGHLAGQLPEYMLPSAYVRLDALPLSPNGKLDRDALPAPAATDSGMQDYEAPVGATEETLSRIWAEVLKLERVGRHDHFFEIGGHSLLAVTLIERMRQAGIAADVRALFATPTIAELAVAVGTPGGIEVPPNGITPDAERITPDMLTLVRLDAAQIDSIVRGVDGGAANVQDIYPLAPLQEGILFHHLMADEGDPYLLHGLFSFDSRERLTSYVNALQAVIDRHDILRTAVVWEGLPEPVQVVWRRAPLSIEEVELDAARGDIGQQLLERFNPRTWRLDVQRAPLKRLFVAHDAAQSRWVMLLLFHHLSLDHTTMEVVQQEVQAHLLGQADQLPRSLPFRNFVAQARLTVPREEHEAFFRRMLGDIDETTAPFGLANVHGDGRGIAEAWRALDATLAKRLRAQARVLGVSAASLFHLAWALVLARSSGRDDVVFGTLLFGRMHAGTGADRVLGLFINTLPVRLPVGTGSVESRVRGTHAVLTELLRHEHAPLALAQRCSGVAAPAPLFSALLNYRHSTTLLNYHEGADAAAGSGDYRAKIDQAWEGIEVLGGEERTNYPLILSVDDLGEGFGLTVQVQSPIDPQHVCSYMQAALEQVVQALESAPDRAVSTLSVLPESERERMLVQWNATQSAYPRQGCLHELFEAQVQRTPESTALVHGEQSLSYRELDERANRLAHHLRGLGVVPDARVALCVQRDADMVVGMLGVLKAGAAYVPLDPRYPAQRLAHILADSAPLAVLTQSAVWDELGDALAPSLAGTPVLRLDVQPLPEARHNPERQAGPDHLAYVIYTSGSTGQPKGVAIEHRNAVNFIHWATQSFSAQELSQTLWSTSLNFDLAVYECFAPLSVGGCVQLVDNALALVDQPRAVTLINTVPSALDALLQARAVPDSVHTVNLAGEPLKQALVQRLFEQTRVQRVCNLYGPSETTTYSTWVSMCRAEGFKPHIGRPVANTRVYLLDAHGQPVPQGVIGEIHIAGDGVARGYLNQPQLTAERFLADPFAQEPGQRMYKTGDLGRYLSDGNIEFLGRNDHQVKIRGFRIELGEIEAKLAQCTGVTEAVVLAREDSPGDKRLVAYVTGEQADSHALREHLARQLPEHMVPAAYVHLPQLPLTPNGKLDRQALPQPEYVAIGYEAPLGQTEQALAAIWAEALQLEQVGRHDNFFELGGHSLLAVSVMERMRQAGLSADVRRLFSTPTIAALAASLHDTNSDLVQVPPNGIPPHCDAITPDMLPLVQLSHAHIQRIVQAVPGGAPNVQDIYPLAPLQEGILFHHLMARQGDTYVMPALFSFDSRERLQDYLRALQTVVDRNDVLRTAVLWEDLPEPVQVVWRRAELAVEEVTIEDGNVAAQLRERFDPKHHRLPLGKAPLMQAAVAQDKSLGRWVLLLLTHHLAVDHTTLEVVRQEIEATMQGQALPAPQPYRNFVAQARLGVSRQEHEAFFRQMLHDVEETTTPFGLLEVPGETGEVQEAQHELDASLSRRIRECARSLGVNVAAVCHLAWAQVLARVSGRDDVVFGTVLFGRLQGAGVDRAVGLFINTLPLRMRVDDTGVQRAVRDTHELLTQLMRHEHASLALAQRCSGVPAPAPLFSALFNYRHSAPQVSSADASDGIEFLGAQERTNYPLLLSVDDLGVGLGLSVQVCPPIDPQRVCAYMERALQQLVQALESAPEQALSSLDVMPASEREQVLVGWNATQVAYPPDTCLHELFEAQVQRTPDALALVQGECRLSYRELNERANRLAHRLIDECDVDRGALVGLCLERGAAMVTAMLAVLKAGGAYVPLDPAYPAQRLAWMLHDSAAGVVLTQSHLQGPLAGPARQLVLLDQDQGTAHPPGNPARRATPQDLAYVIYTSGSTGQPKGVAIEHRNTVNFVQWARQAFSAQELARTLMSTSLNFDLAVYECFVPLSVGGCVQLVDNALALLQQPVHASLINTVPSALQALLQARAVPGSVCTVNLAGEPLKRSLVQQLFEHSQVQRVCNLYGPSETTTYSTWVSMPRESGFAPHIGRPIANTRIYLLDPKGRPVPIGVVGELVIGGAGVARGYLHREALTAERFLADPFATEPGARMYRTGDLARHLSDGNIEFLGRNDHQVKIRGFRIEPGEIEAKLAQCPGVTEAVVLAREDSPGDKRLVAYVTGEQADSQVLREYLSGQLPEYMVPAAYVHLEQLPLTPNGKLDRSALPQPDSLAIIVNGYEAPVGDVEATLAQIWAEELQIEQVGRHDNFFELGGHSLLAVSVMERMRQAGLSADVQRLFTTPTIATFAASVHEDSGRVEVPPNLIPAKAAKSPSETSNLLDLRV
jgi:amino acid adenylation domain-containing protein